MADERSIIDKLFEGVDIEKYYPSNWAGKDIYNFFSPLEIGGLNEGEDEVVAARNARWAAAKPAEREKIRQEQREAGAAETLRRASLPTEKPFISVSRTDAPRSQATSMPTKEDIISRVLAPKRGEYPPRTATQTVPFPINKRRAATLKREQQSMPKIVTEDIATLAKKLREKEKARGTQKAVSTMLEDRQTAPSGKDIRSGEKAEKKRKIAAAKKKRYQPSTASETAATKKTRKAVGTLLKDRQTAPDEVVIESARKAEAKRKAAKLKRKRANELKTRAADKKIAGPAKFLESRAYKTKPTVVTEKKVEPKVVKKVAKGKKPTPIKEALGTGRKPHTVESGQTLSGIAKQHNTTLKALLAANPKLKGRPNLIKVGEKIKIRGPLKKAASPYKGMTKKEWEKITTASKKQREQRSARKTGGGVGLHTAEMRSAGKDLHQPQSKIKKRIHEEITYAKKGGKVGKKKQGYKARKDESIAMRVKKKRTKKQLKASRNESYGKWGKGKGKGKINRFGDSLVASTYD